MQCNYSLLKFINKKSLPIHFTTIGKVQFAACCYTYIPTGLPRTSRLWGHSLGSYIFFPLKVILYKSVRLSFKF